MDNHRLNPASECTSVFFGGMEMELLVLILTTCCANTRLFSNQSNQLGEK